MNLGVLDLTSDEFILDEVDIHIQQNLEDDVVKAALESVSIILPTPNLARNLTVMDTTIQKV